MSEPYRPIVVVLDDGRQGRAHSVTAAKRWANAEARTEYLIFREPKRRPHVHVAVGGVRRVRRPAA
jgi:hypothetical protein